MSWLMARPVVLCVVLASLCVAGAVSVTAQTATGEKADPEPLTVVQDESAVEKRIRAYLLRQDYVVHTEYLDEEMEDLVLLLTFGGEEGVPDITFEIDTFSTAHDDSERGIRIMALYELPDKAKTPAERRKILEINNEYMREKWAPDRIYLNGNGDIVLQSSLNMLSEGGPVHLANVEDLLVRAAIGWKDYWTKLRMEADVE